MDNPKSKATILKIVQEAASKDIILFCYCGPTEGDHCHRFILLDLIREAAKEEGVTITVQTVREAQQSTIWDW